METLRVPHPNAAGFSIKKSQLDNLFIYANNAISDKGLENSYQVDYIFNRNENVSEIGMTIANNSYLWGNDIEEPTVIVESIPVNYDNIMFMGEDKDSIKFTFGGVEYVKFKDSKFADALRACPPNFNITVYGRFGKNTWAGRTTTQLIISDYDIEELEEFDF